MTQMHRTHTAQGKPKLLVTDPEYTLSVIGLVASFCSQPLVGLIISAIALKRSKEAGRQNTYALVGLILGISLLLVLIVGGILYAVILSYLISNSGHKW